MTRLHRSSKFRLSSTVNCSEVRTVPLRKVSTLERVESTQQEFADKNVTERSNTQLVLKHVLQYGIR